MTAKELQSFRDSKKLSEAQRELCFEQVHLLQEKGKLVAVSAFATVEEIDAYGMTNAEHMAILRGIRKLDCLSISSRIHLVIDGKSDFNIKKHYPHREITTIIDGDDKVKEIGMASIIAKVSRDRVMQALPKKYHKYGFAQHKGYGTQLHKEKIAQYGPSDLHRRLFLKWLFPEHMVQRKLPTSF
ncbi:MAG: ribonuclease HII [Candidatus Peribacteria bacterium]|nr:ribonuclease HII [Candidatus Peribacteria bacterium]